MRAPPPILKALRENIEAPPKEFTGIIVAKGSVRFFRTDLPVWAKGAAGGDEKLLIGIAAASGRSY